MHRRSFVPVLILLMPMVSVAQPLADRVPDDAVVYVGWRGSEAMGPGFETSHLKGVLDSSGFAQVVDTLLPQLMEKIAEQDDDAARGMQVISAIALPLRKYPSAIYFGGVDFTNPKKPMPRLALLCDAGEESKALAAQVRALIAQADEEVPVEVKLYGGPVAVVFGRMPDNFDALLGGPQAVAPAGALAKHKPFRDALNRAHADPVAAAYVDVEALLALGDRAVEAGRDRQAKRNWPRLRDALGLRSFKRFIWTGAFDGQDWSQRAFVAAPAPRAGLAAAMIDAEPLGDDILKLVPSTATSFAAFRFDPGNMLAQARDVAGQIEPAAPAQIDQMLQQIQAMTGLNIQNDLLDPLGDQWAYYVDPNVGGSYSFGVAVVNRLDDPLKATQSLDRFADAANNLLGMALANAGVNVEIRDTMVGELKIHYLAAPLVRPAWAVHEGNLYFALYPQVVASASARRGKSMLGNETFAALRQRLGGQKATAIRYADLPKTAPVMYSTWLLLSSYVGVADLFEMDSPAMLLPPLHELLPHLSAAGAVSWADDAGWHMRGLSPFPGSETISSDPSLSLVGPAVAIGVLVPSLTRARETANRVKCASNMRQIGLAILMFANDNKGKFPADLGELMMTQDITPEVFICPSASERLPPEVRAQPLEQRAQWVNANSHYVYLGAGLTSEAPADIIILHENFENHDEDGVNMLYADGHVEWHTIESAEAVLAEQKAGGGL